MKNLNDLYPLTFNPIYKEKIWGGNKINKTLRRSDAPNRLCGESWEISTVKDNVSTVSNGSLEGLPLDLVISYFKEDLVGKRNYMEYKDSFPLLIKFIDAQQDLSIQVHPDNELAMKRHGCLGKTEMWYIMEAEEGAEIINGFSKRIEKDSYFDIFDQSDSIYNKQKVEAGDVIFIPAGTVHAIGSGIMLAEIQQSSDITYRIHDYDRKDDQGKLRELHLEHAKDAINFVDTKSYLKHTDEDAFPEVVSCPFFTTNYLNMKEPEIRNYADIDSFVVYMVVDGSAQVKSGSHWITLGKGEVCMIPACHNYTEIRPLSPLKMLEVYNY